MKSQIIKSIIAALLILATSSLHAWQAGETSGGNTAEDTATTPLNSAPPISGDAPGALDKQVHTDRVAESESIIITWSENNDELRGYSSRGGWETLSIEKQNAISPIVGSDVAAVRIGNSIAAFGGRNSWWDVLQLSNHSVALPTVSKDLVQIEDNGHLYTFSAAKSGWASPTDPEFQEATSELRLPYGWPKHRRQKLNEWVHSLPLYKARGIAFNFTSGRTTLASIHAARRSWLKEAEDKVNELAAQPEPKTTFEPVANLSSRPDDATGLESRIASLREELLRLDREVNSPANDLDGKAREARKQELRKLVTKMFDLRRLLQLAEVQHLRIKLEWIEENIYARSGSKNREDIIEHRVRELLDSNGKQTGRGAGDKTSSTANSEMPVTGTPIGLPGPPHLPYGDPAGLESHQVRNSDGRIQWPQPAENFNNLQECRNRVTTCLRILKQSKRTIEISSTPLEELKAAGHVGPRMSESQWSAEITAAKRSVESDQETLDRAMRDWNQAWASYRSQLRLLQLDVEEANLAVEPLQQNHDRLKRMVESGAAPVGEVTQAASDLAIARIKVQRAEELLKLYADIEAKEPMLNPDSFKSEK